MSLAGKAFKSEDSKGRFREYDEDAGYFSIDPYELDTIKILSSKANRRLSYKTQVFNKPYNKHVRTRKSHTEEVVAVSKLISYTLGLNANLCNSIAHGHDIGHFPFGHATEQIFTKKLRESTGVKDLVLDHSLMGLIITHQIERKGAGLNLTYETMEGILNHSIGEGGFMNRVNSLEEYRVVMYADKIAYLFSDVNDAERLGALKPGSDEFEPVYDNLRMISKVGNQRARTYSCIASLIEESNNKGFVSFSEGEVFNSFTALKNKMFELVYKKVDWDIQNLMIEKVCRVLDKAVLDDYLKVCGNFIKKYNDSREESGFEVKAAEFVPHPFLVISLLTDNDVEVLVNKQIASNSLTLKDILFKTPLSEMVPYLLTKDIDVVGLSRKWGEYGKDNPNLFLDEFLKI